MSGGTPVRAQDLKAGQRIYLGHRNGWFSLAADARPHRVTKTVSVLEFIRIPDEYRPANEAMLVRPPRRRVSGTAGQPR